MKTSLVLTLLLPILGSLSSWAQTSAPGEDSKPATSNIPGQPYPRIDSELRCTFRLKAPDAQKVRLHLDKDYDLERDTNGVWSVTTTPAIDL